MDPAGSRRGRVIQPPADLLLQAKAALSADLELARDAGGLPSGPGSYLLFVHLASGLTLDISKFAGRTLEPGWFVYAGSARGPGGIAARAGRHLRTDKALRWHIDHLTCAADEVWAAPALERSECEIAEGLSGDPRFTVPVEGFGSSDCLTCRAHLVAFSPRLSSGKA